MGWEKKNEMRREEIQMRGCMQSSGARCAINVPDGQAHAKNKEGKKIRGPILGPFGSVNPFWLLFHCEGVQVAESTSLVRFLVYCALTGNAKSLVEKNMSRQLFVEGAWSQCSKAYQLGAQDWIEFGLF